MAEAPASSFENPDRHAAVSDIIKRASTNRADVREVVLEGLELSSARKVLDLGCGFGFMGEAVAGRVAPEARIVGVDICATNERPYLERVAARGRRGRFVCRRLETRLDWPDHEFDLVVASYALYFFPGVLPEIARVLAPDGLFLAVTHTESSCRDLLRAVGVPTCDSQRWAYIHRFSAEEGDRVLAPWFGEVERVDYRNSLAFEAAQRDDLLAFLRFKLPFLLPDFEPDSPLPDSITRAVGAALSDHTRVVFDKSDAAFRCRCPRCP